MATIILTLAPARFFEQTEGVACAGRLLTAKDCGVGVKDLQYFAVADRVQSHALTSTDVDYLTLSVATREVDQPLHSLLPYLR